MNCPIKKKKTNKPTVIISLGVERGRKMWPVATPKVKELWSPIFFP
jgi:hypothetical protein